MSNTPTILTEIVARRRTHLPEIAARLAGVRDDDLTVSHRSLYEAVMSSTVGAHYMNYIMECKSASPSLGLIRADYDPGAIARIYSRYAAAISVLCEPERFNGDYDHLATVAASTHLPVLCKDFIIDEVQIRAARYFGADAILLMLSILSDEEYLRLSQYAARFGLDVLTEVVDEQEMQRARTMGAKIIGINHRNLHDLSIDLDRSARLAPLAPSGAAIIAESGIRSHQTAARIGAHVHGFLVGSHLTGTPDVDAAVRELLYGPVKVCGLRTPTAAQAARAAGATYGGLIFEPASPRQVDAAAAAAIIAAEPGLQYVAVSRRTSGYQDLLLLGVRAVQVHAPLGSPAHEAEMLAAIRAELDAVDPSVELWRAVDMTAPSALDVVNSVRTLLDKFVLDSGAGGTGQTFDWSRIPADIKEHSLLAGGLNPANLAAALETGCAGVDLNSGVEYGGPAPYTHHKDPAKIAAALSVVRYSARAL